MYVYQLALACLMFSNSPSMVKKCEKVIQIKCSNSRTIEQCYKSTAPDINILMKKQFSKAVVLQ